MSARPIAELRLTERVAGRFWPRVDQSDPQGCWPWTGERCPKGYGQVYYRDASGQYVQRKAHRIAYTLHSGVEPLGLLVCHTCDNPPCCNPSHLWPGTVRDNAIDMMRKGRNHPIPRGFGSGRTVWRTAWKLTPEQVREIRERYRSGAASQEQLAKEMGVHQTTVSRVVTGIRWKDVP